MLRASGSLRRVLVQAIARSEGDIPKGSAQFREKERALEEQYVRKHEAEKLAAKKAADAKAAGDKAAKPAPAAGSKPKAAPKK